LKPETAQTWDVGFTVKRGALDFGMTWFTTYYENKIATANSHYYNVGGTTNYQGLEATTGFDVGAALAKK
jgi:outer membrane cobalamin receptor